MKVLAFDFGASSGRAILGEYTGKNLKLQEIHRFSNDPVMINQVFYWDILRLFHEIKQGIQKCVKAGHSDISSISIDTWGVDFGLLDEYGNLLENPIHYRDARFDDIMEKTFAKCSQNEIYEKTGIQFLKFNTIFQLDWLKQNRPEMLEKTSVMLMIPDLLSYFLTGVKNAEYTIASTTQLVNAESGNWDYDIINKLGINPKIFPEIIKTGSLKGKLLPDIAEELGIDQVDIIACASHDTASAVVSAPLLKSENADDSVCSAYISCGTWSLLGAELSKPFINEDSFSHNFTNEGGYSDTIRFLKNISGLWLLQETRKHWNSQGENISFKDIDKMLETAVSANVYIDPDYPDFVSPGNIPQKINDFLKKTGQKTLTDKGQLALCILESLAMTYKYYILSMEKILGKTVETVHLIGGGVQDRNLCQFTANSTQKKVVAGPIEATAIGNIAVQLISKNAFEDMTQARQKLGDLEIFTSQNNEMWDKKYSEFLKYKNIK